MAQLDRNYVGGFVDKRRTQAGTTNVLATPASYAGLPAMRARLTAIDGTLYSAANLNKMTYNDMIYAIRVADDTAGI